MKIGIKQIILVIVLLTFVGLVQACIGSGTPQVNSPSTAKEATAAANNNSVTEATAPEFIGVDIVTNQEITLSSYKGSVVLLNFVNYGCNAELNNVVSEQLLAIRDLKEQRGDFVPVSVFCGCCPPEVLRDYAGQNSFTWPWILDTDYSIIKDYASHLGNYGYPTLVFIDQEQNIRAVTGYSDLSALSDKLGQILVESN
ncbi:peroxiredoxin family protein [Chloroflexota bacterium]